ncbi:hypothetical protein THTE_3677 [Thermogutta terrifontis]|uniref:Uncharacterized protein n=1 Tax=Thermogutta terrifontis TaxID=1331910 RepID=A0A286RJY0_9BACT|nr:hypothetical protein THTE_3677 [Thermogutta terrifontis]
MFKVAPWTSQAGPSGLTFTPAEGLGEVRVRSRLQKKVRTKRARQGC